MRAVVVIGLLSIAGLLTTFSPAASAAIPKRYAYFIDGATIRVVDHITNTQEKVLGLPFSAGTLLSLPSLKRLCAVGSTTGAAVIETVNHTVVNSLTGPVGAAAAAPSINRIYLVVSGGIAVINATTGLVVQTIPTGDFTVQGLTALPSGQRVYVWGYGPYPEVWNRAFLSFIDTATNVLSPPLFRKWWMLGPVEVAPDGKRLYFQAFDDVEFEQLGVFDPDYGMPRAMNLWSENGVGWIPTLDSRRVFVGTNVGGFRVWLQQLSMVDAIGLGIAIPDILGLGQIVSGWEMTPDGKRIYAGTFDNHGLYLIDPNSGAKAGIPIAGLCQATPNWMWLLGVSRGSKYIYLRTSCDSEILVIDTASHQVAGRLFGHVFAERPARTSPDGRRVYTSTSTQYVIADTNSHEIVGTQPVAPAAYGFDPYVTVDSDLRQTRLYGHMADNGECGIGKIYEVEAWWQNLGQRHWTDAFGELPYFLRGNQTIGQTWDLTADGIVKPGETMKAVFQIRLASCASYPFRVTVLANAKPLTETPN